MFDCRDLFDTSRIWRNNVDIIRIKVQVSCVYLFFLIMIFIQFHYMVEGSCKPSHMCTNICLKVIKQCLCFLFDRLWLQPCHCITVHPESTFIVYILLFSLLSILFYIHFITVWENIGGVREQAGSFWVLDESMLLELLCNPNQSIKFLIQLWHKCV